MTKRKKKEGIQTGLFDQGMFKPVDLHNEPPAEIVTEQKTIEVGGIEIPYVEAHLHRPRIALGSTTSCPVCGADVKLYPDGIIRCLQCYWYQGASE